MKRILCLILTLAVAVSLLAACGSSSGESADPTEAAGGDPAGSNAISNSAMTGGLSKDTIPGFIVYSGDEYPAQKLTLGCSGAGSTFTPFGRPTWGSISVPELMFQKLLRVDNYGDIYYELLKDIEKVDDLTYNLILWDNIYDTEGNHFTAFDVLYSMDLFLATGNTGSVSRLDYLEVGSDEYTVIWHCKEPFGLGELGKQLAFPRMVTQAAWEASPDDMTTSPVGTGPYKLVDYTPGVVAVFEVDENFWMRNLPDDVKEGLWVYAYQNVKEIEVQVIRDASSRAIALERGDIDAADAIEQVDLKAFEGNDEIVPVLIANDAPIPIIFNCSDASPCSDENLRKAICYALDSAAVAAAVGVGGYQVYGFQPNLFDSPEEWRTGRDYYDFSVDKAKEYLEKSDYDGQELRLMYVSSTAAAFGTTAISVQSQLGELGINVKLNPVEQALNEVRRFQEDDWDMRFEVFFGGDYCVQTYTAFHSSTYSASLGDKNLFMVVDKKLDELYEAWDADPTSVERLNEYDDYFTFEKCYGYAVVGYNLLTAARKGVGVVMGDRATNMAPNAFTFE